jgi:hypothetical protein
MWTSTVPGPMAPACSGQANRAITRPFTTAGVFRTSNSIVANSGGVSSAGSPPTNA